jgi:hypothetical protein
MAYSTGGRRNKEELAETWVDFASSTPRKQNRCLDGLTQYFNRLSRFGWLVLVSAAVLATYGIVLIVLGLRGNLEGFGDYFYSFMFGLSCMFMIFPYQGLPARKVDGVIVPSDNDPVTPFYERTRYWFYEWIGQFFFVFMLVHLATSIIVVEYGSIGAHDKLLNVYTILIALAITLGLVWYFKVNGHAYAVSFAFLALLLISSDVELPILTVGIAGVIATVYLLFHFMKSIAHDISYHLTVGACTAISFLFTFFQNYEDWLTVPVSQYHPVMISGLILAMTRALWAYLFGFIFQGDASDTKTVDPVLVVPKVSYKDTQALELHSAPPPPPTSTA